MIESRRVVYSVKMMRDSRWRGIQVVDLIKVLFFFFRGEGEGFVSKGNKGNEGNKVNRVN